MALPIAGFLVGSMASGSAPVMAFLTPATYEITQMAWQNVPVRIPTFQEALGQYVSGHIGTALFREWSKKDGYLMDSVNWSATQCTRTDGGTIVPNVPPYSDEEWIASNMVVMSATANPPMQEIVTWYYRGFINGDLAKWLMLRNGITDSNLQSLYLAAGEQIPGPSDLVRFGLREAFDPNIVDRYGYANEMPTAILPWMERQGLGGDTGVARPAALDVAGNPIPAGQAKWFDLYWWSHWDLPSPTQGYEMLFRFYADSEFGPSPYHSADTNFSEQDLSTLLRTLDYPAYWRKRLQGISYRVLTRIDVRRMFKLGVLSEAEVYHAYRSQGYNDLDAKRLLGFTKEDARAQQRKTDITWTKDGALKYYKAGIIDNRTLRGMLLELGLNQRGVELFIQKADNDLRVESVNETIKLAKRVYFTGLIDDDQLIKLLADSGMLIDRVQHYAARWKMQKQYRHKQNSTMEIVKAFKLGIIADKEMTARLYNLGYQAKEVSLIVLIAQRELEDTRTQQLIRKRQADSILQEKQEAKADRETRQRERDQMQRLRDSQKAERERFRVEDKANREAIRTLLSPYSEKNIIAMFNAQQLTLEHVLQILNLKGWVNNAIVKWINTYLLKTKEGDSSDAIPEEEND
jgi:hypothetical protein